MYLLTFSADFAHFLSRYEYPAQVLDALMPSWSLSNKQKAACGT